MLSYALWNLKKLLENDKITASCPTKYFANIVSNIPGISNQTKSNQNSIAPNWTPIIQLGSLIEHLFCCTEFNYWTIEQNQMQSNSIWFSLVWNPFLVCMLKMSWLASSISHFKRSSLGTDLLKNTLYQINSKTSFDTPLQHIIIILICTVSSKVSWIDCEQSLRMVTRARKARARKSSEASESLPSLDSTDVTDVSWV